MSIDYVVDHRVRLEMIDTAQFTVVWKRAAGISDESCISMKTLPSFPLNESHECYVIEHLVEGHHKTSSSYALATTALFNGFIRPTASLPYLHRV